ncbi:MAG TPA: hypothetical protein PL009_12020 [Flavipsychrobacter sp.]|nr:hypothetical protein [Flavipsychrobacter sp.]
MKLRTILFFTLIVFLAAPQKSSGQIWKKLFGKEEKRKPRPRPKPAIKPKDKQAGEIATKKKRKTLEYPASKIKSRYRIDVLVPLYLDELVKDNKLSFKDKIPEKAAIGVSFYEGIKLAADTLTAMGYNVDVFIHDVTQQGLTPNELVKGEVLEETDLVIGALQSAQIPVVAEFAKKRQVNFISVISPSDANVKDNLFFTMLQPTLETHCERIREAALKKTSGKKTILFYRTNDNVDSLAYSYILSEGEKPFTKVLLNKLLQKKQLEQSFDSASTNFIVMPIVDNGYAESILQQLHEWFPRYQFEVFGMPSWKFINTLRKPDAYPNVAVNFTSPFHYDITTTMAQTLSANYKKQFGGRMAEMVFRGYDVVFWYAYLLQNYGTVYNTKQSDNKVAPFIKFEIKPQWDIQQNLLYNENEHLFLYRYQSASFLVNSLD